MKKLLRKIHLYLGLFTLPMGLLLAVTGVLYIAGFNQDSGATIEKYTLDGVVIEAGNEVAFLNDWTKQNNVEMPRTTEIGEGKGGTAIIGTPHYGLEIKSGENQTIITTTKRSVLGDMIMIHKAKVRWFANVLSILLGISMLLFYISGIVIASFKKNVNGEKVLKKEYIITLVLGVIITTAVCVASVI